MANQSKSDLPRLSGKEQLILSMLVSGGGAEKYGLEMVRESGDQLPRGTVYVTLGRMEEKGLIESRPEPAGPGVRGIPRRLYRVTGHGARVLAAWERYAMAVQGRSTLLPT